MRSHRSSGQRNLIDHPLAKKVRKPQNGFRTVFQIKSASVFLVADVLFLGGIEREVADGSDENVDSHSDDSEAEVGAGSAGESLGLERSVVDDERAKPSEEEGQQEAYEIVVVYDTLMIKFGQLYNEIGHHAKKKYPY